MAYRILEGIPDEEASAVAVVEVARDSGRWDESAWTLPPLKCSK